MVRVILYIYVALLLVACSKNESTPSGTEGESGMVDVTISTLIDDGSTNSRAESESEPTIEKFSNQDQIGVFLCKAGEDGEDLWEEKSGLLMYHTTSYYRNLMAEYSSTNQEWIFFVSYTGYMIVPSVYDNNSTMEGNLDCYAYSPYIRTAGQDVLDITDILDDDDEIFDDITQVPLVNGRDVMWAVGYDPNNPDDDSEETEKLNQDIVVTADSPLNITLKFKRAMTKVDFEFSLKNEQTGVTVDTIILATTNKEKQMLLEGAIIDGRNGDMYEDSIIDTDTIKMVSLLAIDSDPDETTTYEALLIPFNMEQEDVLVTESGSVELILVINGQRTYNTLPLRAMELVRGNCYTMKIEIDNFLKISTTQGLTLDDNWTGVQEGIII